MPVSYSEYVKKPNLEIEYEPWQIEEIIKCADSFFYFCKYVKIVHPDLGRIEFVLRDYQEELSSHILDSNRIIAKWPRQSGKSQLLSVFVVWYSIFNSDKFVGIASNKANSAKDFLYRVKLSLEEIPNWLKPGIVEYNKTSIELENGTRIQSSATTKDTFRGRTINLLILDEFAHLRPSVADEFWTSNYHTVVASQESKIIIISTPKGMFNLFWRIYRESEQGLNTFKHMHMDYRRVPGRSEDWKQEQLKNMSLSDWKQEQECEFLGSTSTVIDSAVLRNLIVNYKNPIIIDNDLYVYEKPNQENIYIVGVDVAKGTGNNYSAIQVLKIASFKPIRLEQVATYNNNTIDVYKFSEMVYRTAMYYNRAYVMIENNAEGAAVVNRIWWDFEYMNMYNSGSKINELGIRATKTTKPQAILLMKKFLEDYSLTLVDKTTIDQLSDYSEQSGKFGCINLNDDLVSALYWSIHLFNTDWLVETYEFDKERVDDDVWGILSDIQEKEDNWNWLNSSGLPII